MSARHSQRITKVCSIPGGATVWLVTSLRASIHGGNDPARAGDYDAASPCSHSDCPQTVLEPILVRHSTRMGFTCRFNSAFVGFEQVSGGVISTVEDNVTKAQYKIRSKFLFGCDGARSSM